MRRKARQARRRLQPAGVDRQQDQREEDDREQLERLAQRLQHRAPRQHADLRSTARAVHDGDRRGALASPSPSPAIASLRRPRPPASARSSRGRRRRAWASAGAGRRSVGPRRRACARSPRGRRRPRAAARRRAFGAAAASSPKRCSTSARRSRSPGSAGIASTLGRPIAAFSSAGVPSATILPLVDDADAVGQHVGLLEVLRRQEHRHAVVGQPADLVPQRRAALQVEAGRRLVEEQQPRAVHEREAEVEPALHPARVAAHLAVGRVGQPDALEQLAAAPFALGLAEPVQRALQAHVLAAGQERVERRLLQRGADRAPHLGALAHDVEARHARARRRSAAAAS